MLQGLSRRPISSMSSVSVTGHLFSNSCSRTCPCSHVLLAAKSAHKHALMGPPYPSLRVHALIYVYAYTHICVHACSATEKQRALFCAAIKDIHGSEVRMTDAFSLFNMRAGMWLHMCAHMCLGMCVGTIHDDLVPMIYLGPVTCD